MKYGCGGEGFCGGDVVKTEVVVKVFVVVMW